MRYDCRLRILPVAALTVLAIAATTIAQEKKATPLLPKVVVTMPLGIAPGKTTRLTIRGLGLEQAAAIRFPAAPVAVRILSKGKATVPTPFPPAKMGDTQVEAEITIPASLRLDELPFVVETPAGESPPYSLLLGCPIPLVEEVEVNNGFAQAQLLKVPQAVDGLFQKNKDVDVFRIDGVAGQRLVFEVVAARRGSPVDSLLTLYDAAGHELAANDDAGNSTDSLLQVTLPKTGAYFLSLSDAQEKGGPAYVYRLLARSPGR